MRVELLPGMTNVVRFPVERRAQPRLELLRGIAPECPRSAKSRRGFRDGDACP